MACIVKAFLCKDASPRRAQSRTNSKSQIITNDQIYNNQTALNAAIESYLIIGAWSLKFVCYLVLEIRCFTEGRRYSFIASYTSSRVFCATTRARSEPSAMIPVI